MRKTTRIVLAVLVACLAVPAFALAKPSTHPVKPPVVKPVAYEFAGSIVSVATDSYGVTTLTVKVKRVNRNGKLLRGTTVTFVLTAKTVIHKAGKRKSGKVADLHAGDKVVIFSWAPRKLTAGYTFTARRIDDLTKVKKTVKH